MASPLHLSVLKRVGELGRLAAIAKRRQPARRPDIMLRPRQAAALAALRAQSMTAEEMARKTGWLPSETVLILAGLAFRNHIALDASNVWRAL